MTSAIHRARADEAGGRWDDARAGYLAVLAAEPENAVAAYRLGLVCRQMGRLGEALPWLQKALRLSNHPDVAIDFAAALQAAGQWAPAEAIFSLALRLAPGAPDALFGRAVCHHQLGWLEVAAADYRALLAVCPGLPPAYENLGQLLIAADKAGEAAALLAAGVARCGEVPALWRLWLQALVLAGDTALAVRVAPRTLALLPDAPAVWALAMSGQEAAGQLVPAVAAGDRALRLSGNAADPAMITVALSLADLQRRLGRPEAALAPLRTALHHDPQRVGGWWQLGRVWMDLDQPGAAARAFGIAVALAPGDADRLLDLAGALARADDAAGAATVYRRVSVLDPLNGLALGHAIEQCFKRCAWDGLDADIDRLLALLRDRGAVVPPFGLLALPGATSADQRLAAERWTAWKLGTVAPTVRPSMPASDGRLAVGYLSSDFREHAISHLMVGVLEAHDRARFAVTAYAIGPDDQSPMRARVRAGVERFVDLRACDDATAARRIAADGIDILVDVNGYTAFARTGVLAARPAPVQINWLGYPGTMGAGFIDYILADAMVIPPGAEAGYTETVVRLPHCYQPNDDKRPIGETPVSRAGAGLPENGFVFCCFNNLHKITRPVFGQWMGLLHAVPCSVLWLLAGLPDAMAHLRGAAARAGIDPARLVFAPRAPAAEHLARHRLADLFLDTLPYNAHTTASDALWAGVPVVTRRGDTFAGRVAASLLTAVGLPELITDTADDYTALALVLARDPAGLAAVRARLAANRQTFPLFDTQGFTRGLEDTLLLLSKDIAAKAAIIPG